MISSSLHNKITNEFVLNINRIIKEGGGYPEILTVLESMMLAVMLTNVKVFKMKPQISSGMVESAYDAALERFVAQTGK